MTNRKAKAGILLGCAALLAALFAFYAHGESRQAAPISLLTEAEYAKLLLLPAAEGQAPFTGAPCVEGTPLPYDAVSGLYYLPQSLSTEAWDGSLSWNGAGEAAYFVPDALYGQKKRAIAEGHVFTLLITDGKRRAERHIVLTGLPMMDLTTLAKTSFAFDDDVPTGRMSFFDPDAEGGYRVTVSYMTYRTRGNVSLSYPKHSYRVRLFLGNGQKNPQPLGRLSENSAWILNPLYSDQNRVRDGLSAALWQALCLDKPASNRFYATFQYIETLRDGRYYGLFGLMEPMTARMAEFVQPGDVVYLGRIVDDALKPAMIGEYKTGLTSPAADIEYPQAWSGEALWEPLEAYTNAFWFDAGQRDFTELAALVDVDNVIDHALFTQLTANTDHNFTNNYFFAERREDGSYIMFDVPWDFNHTFGNRLSGAPRFGDFSMAVAKRDYSSRVFRVLCQSAPERMAERTMIRWRELRKGPFSEEALLIMLQSAMDGLVSSGALSREAGRWPDSGVSGDLQELNEFVHARLSYLDGWVENLSEEYADGE